MHLTTIDEIKDYSNIFSSLLDDETSNNEIIQLIEKHISGDDRIIYLKVKSGSKVSKAEMNKLTVKLQQIVCDNG